MLVVGFFLMFPKEKLTLKKNDQNETFSDTF